MLENLSLWKRKSQDCVKYVAEVIVNIYRACSRRPPKGEQRSLRSALCSVCLCEATSLRESQQRDVLLSS